MNRLELIRKKIKELKLYKEYLLNLKVISNFDEEEIEEDKKENNEVVKKKIKTK